MIKNNVERTKLLYSCSQKQENIQNSKTLRKKDEPHTAHRVDELQEQIQSGEYKIDLKKTSEKMALNLLNL